jgi:hypothetical protein
VNEFHVLDLYGRKKLLKMLAERVPVDTECSERGPLVALHNALFQSSAADVKANGVFDSSWQTMVVDGD